jgi:hypothetical protein
MAQDGAGQETLQEAVAELAPQTALHVVSEPWRALAAVLRLRNHEMQTVISERDALAAQIAALKAELSSGTVGTLTVELAEAVQANERLRRLLTSRVMHVRPGTITGSQGTWWCDLCTGRALETEVFHHAPLCPLATTPAPADAGKGQTVDNSGVK